MGVEATRGANETAPYADVYRDERTASCVHYIRERHTDRAMLRSCEELLRKPCVRV